MARRDTNGGSDRLRDLRDPLAAATWDRVAVADADDLRVERRDPRERDPVLRQVEVERLPAGAQLGPRRDRVAGDQEAALRPPEREVTRRVAGRVQDLE